MDRKSKIRRGVVTFGIILIAITTISPFIWMISSSLKYESDIFKYPIEWIPSRWNAINNYREVWSEEYQIGLMYWNTIKVAVLKTAFDLIICLMAAYAFAKIKFKFKNAIFLLFLGSWMLPPQITLIPKFMILQKMGLYDTHTGLIITGLFSAYGVFLLRQFLITIPDALSESAKIDGASHLSIFSKIIVPIAMPAIATLAVLRFVWSWNDYQNPLVFLSSKELFTLQRGMAQFADQDGTLYSLLMAAAVCAIIPLLVVFLFLQRYVIEGIAGGAVKG